MKTRVYRRMVGEECIQTARLRELVSGKFAFETNLFGKPYEVNMNMPMFETEAEAYDWIEHQSKWLMILDDEKIAPIPVPLSKGEIMRQMQTSKVVYGIIEMELSEFIDSDLESILDTMSERLTGSPLLMGTDYTVVDHEKNTLFVRVSGDPSSILEEFED